VVRGPPLGGRSGLAGGETRLTAWEYALAVWPEVETLCLELQDRHEQCVPLLLWRMWALEEGRPVGPSLLEAAVGTARAWERGAISPLRNVRRALAKELPAEMTGSDLTSRVGAAERTAERLLLDSLTALTPPPGSASTDRLGALAEVATAWRRPVPATLIARLAATAGPGLRRISRTGGSLPADRGLLVSARPGSWISPMDDEQMEDDSDAAARTELAQLRQEHQDLDDAIHALEARPQVDQLQIARLKKKKLGLRDQIAKVEDRLMPDIIA